MGVAPTCLMAGSLKAGHLEIDVSVWPFQILYWVNNYVEVGVDTRDMKCRSSNLFFLK